MYTPKVSVIIPAFNYGATLVRAVNSVRQQTLKDVEIVIINDASTDDTHKIAISLIDSKTVYIRNKTNLGLYATMVKGYKKASGTYVCQLDCDDELPKDSLQIRYDILEKQQLDAVCGGIVLVRGKEHTYVRPVDLRKHSEVRNFLINGNESAGINSATFMYRRGIFKNIGYTSTATTYFPHNDYEFSLRVALKCQVGVIDMPLYIYHLHHNSHSTVNGISAESKAASIKLKKAYIDLF